MEHAGTYVALHRCSKLAPILGSLCCTLCFAYAAANTDARSAGGDTASQRVCFRGYAGTRLLLAVSSRVSLSARHMGIRSRQVRLPFVAGFLIHLEGLGRSHMLAPHIRLVGSG